MQSLSEKCTNIIDTSSSQSKCNSTYPNFYDHNEKFIRGNTVPNIITNSKFQDPLSLKMNSLKIEMYPTPWSQIAATLTTEYTPKGTSCMSNNNTNSNTSSSSAATNENDLENSLTKSTGSSNSHKLNRKTRNRKSLRYMTQPITLIEIKETEEDCNFVQADSVATKPPVVNQSEASEPSDERQIKKDGDDCDQIDSTTSANTQLNSQSYYDQMSFARRQNRKTIERSKMRTGNVGAFD